MNLLFIFVLVSFLLAPGLALSRIFKIKKNLVLHSVALSYSTFYLVFSITSYFKVIETALIPISLSITIACAITVLFFFSTKRLIVRDLTTSIYLTLIVALIVAYNFIFGASSDLPSDLYAHLERFQRVLFDLNNESVDYSLQSISWTKQGYGWYYFLAVCSSLSGVTSSELVESMSLVANTLFLMCFFSFASFIFKQDKGRHIIAFLTCVFIALHMGTSVFALVRYYTLGPTVIGFCIYLTATALFLDSLTNQKFRTLLKTIPILTIYILVCIGNHTQEALFILVICMIASLIYSTKSLQRMSSSKLKRNHISASKNNLFYDLFVAANVVLAILIFFSLFANSHSSLHKPALDTLRLWRFSESWSVFPSITILNLGYQFIQTITLWGCVIYVLFIINYQRYKNNLFILAGMYSPIFTILNPFFVDLFLHHSSSTTLWRLCYLVPIHFVAADIFIHYLRRLKLSSGRTRLSYCLAIGLMLILLLPIKNTWQGVHFSRIPTLVKTEHENSYKYYEDVLNFLDSQPKNTIVTDPITGYLVTAMTHHVSPRRKFFVNNKYNHFSFKHYREDALEKYKGYFLLVNRRAQPNSRIGKLSQHWPENQLKQIHSYHPQALIEHITEHPELFTQLWSNNGITLYQIN